MREADCAAKIHPTASVHPTARLGPGVQIGAYAMIGADTDIGNGTVIGPHVTIGDHIQIGCANQFFPNACIGEGQSRAAAGTGKRPITIGDHNIIREYATIESGTLEGRPTRLGHRNFLMICSHVGRGCSIGSHTVIANATCLEEDVVVGDLAVISGLMRVETCVHIGTAAMLSGLSLVDRDVPPFAIASGNPARLRGLNRIGLKRCGMASGEDGAHLRQLWRLLYRSNLALADALTQARREQLPLPCEQLCRFLEDSSGPGRRGPMPSRRGGKCVAGCNFAT